MKKIILRNTIREELDESYDWYSNEMLDIVDGMTMRANDYLEDEPDSEVGNTAYAVYVIYKPAYTSPHGIGPDGTEVDDERSYYTTRKGAEKAADAFANACRKSGQCAYIYIDELREGVLTGTLKKTVIDEHDF